MHLATPNLATPKRVRARLERIVAPNDARYPHDLLLYPDTDPTAEHWNIVWVKYGIYDQFCSEWDGKTCPSCQTPTIKKFYEEKYTGDMSNSEYSSTAYYDLFNVFKCTQCQCGWTERTGSRSFCDTSYP